MRFLDNITLPLLLCFMRGFRPRLFFCSKLQAFLSSSPFPVKFLFPLDFLVPAHDASLSLFA
jgi:hypothetical protein